MTLTVQSALSSYCPPGEAVKLLDWRPLADLCSDSGTRITSAAALAGDPNFNKLLMAASGEVEAACAVSRRYLPSDLLALTGVSQARLHLLVARIVVVLAYGRRVDLKVEQPWLVQWVEDALHALRDGQRIFGFTETMDAGLFHHYIETDQDRADRNGLVQRACGYFGHLEDH